MVKIRDSSVARQKIETEKRLVEQEQQMKALKNRRYHFEHDFKKGLTTDTKGHTMKIKLV